MPVSPHPITVTVNDTDNATALQGAQVYVRNITKRTSSEEATTDVSGQAIIDLANLPLADGQTNEYDTGDEILIIAYYKNTHDAAEYTVTGASKSQTLNMNHCRHNPIDAEKIQTLVVANTDASNPYYAKVLAVDDGQTLAHVECPSQDTIPIHYGGQGLPGSAGFVVVRENTAVIVTANIK